MFLILVIVVNVTITTFINFLNYYLTNTNIFMNYYVHSHIAV